MMMMMNQAKTINDFDVSRGVHCAKVKMKTACKTQSFTLLQLLEFSKKGKFIACRVSGNLRVLSPIWGTVA